MTNNLIGSVLALTCLVAGPARAEVAIPPQEVIAYLGDAPITAAQAAGHDNLDLPHASRDRLVQAARAHAASIWLASHAYESGLADELPVDLHRLMLWMTTLPAAVDAYHLDRLRTPTQAELDAYFQAHRQHYATRPQATFRHIFIDAPSHLRPARHDRAVDVLQRLHDGTDFEAVAREYSEASVFDEGDVGQEIQADLDRLRPDIVEALRLLQPGETSDLIESERGFEIVRLERRDAGESPALDAVREQVMTDLVRERESAERGILAASAEAVVAVHHVRDDPWDAELDPNAEVLRVGELSLDARTLQWLREAYLDDSISDGAMHEQARRDFLARLVERLRMVEWGLQLGLLDEPAVAGDLQGRELRWLAERTLDYLVSERLAALSDDALRAFTQRPDVAGALRGATETAGRVILIPFDHGPGASDAEILQAHEDAGGLAESIHQTLTRGGDFEAFAGMYPDWPGSDDSGYLAPAAWQDPVFFSATAELAPGRFSEPTMVSELGYAIFRLESRARPKPPDFEAIRDRAAKLYADDARESIREVWQERALREGGFRLSE